MRSIGGPLLVLGPALSYLTINSMVFLLAGKTFTSANPNDLETNYVDPFAPVETQFEKADEVPRDKRNAKAGDALHGMTDRTPIQIDDDHRDKRNAKEGDALHGMTDRTPIQIDEALHLEMRPGPITEKIIPINVGMRDKRNIKEADLLTGEVMPPKTDRSSSEADDMQMRYGFNGADLHFPHPDNVYGARRLIHKKLRGRGGGYHKKYIRKKIRTPKSRKDYKSTRTYYYHRSPLLEIFDIVPVRYRGDYSEEADNEDRIPRKVHRFRRRRRFKTGVPNRHGEIILDPYAM